MKSTAFDRDSVLTDFLSDYLDGNLSRGERKSFEEYLSSNKDEREFVRKAKRGKQLLSKFANKIDLPSVTA